MTEEFDAEAVRHQLVQAYTRAVHPDTLVHLRAALHELDGGLPEDLIKCPVCGRLGMPERVREHDCED
jgi:hypothetical protein